jgi:hypothetical protein
VSLLPQPPLLAKLLLLLRPAKWPALAKLALLATVPTLPLLRLKVPLQPKAQHQLLRLPLKALLQPPLKALLQPPLKALLQPPPKVLLQPLRLLLKVPHQLKALLQPLTPQRLNDQRCS